MYSSIKVTTKYGTFSNKKCEYFIQNNMLTVFRRETIKTDTYGERIIYYPYESHYPMENVVEIECIKG